ncbi:hypothetical protein TNCV_3920391 [Trichonephila clavipes]|nr:hypothetical protein TNCV_3920391 [Trichonephila clavipes]
MIVRSATKKPMTSAQNIANELLSPSSCSVSVSAQTVRNVLHSAGLKARTPRKKPYISEQDNDPKHNAIVTKTWLLYYAPRRLEILPQSPDLNPIENFWMHLDTEVQKKCNKSRELKRKT